MKAENIKFKAKRLDGKGWAIGDLLHSYENGAIIVPIEGGGAFSVDHSTVCQFTGLKDIEGNDIWEHDLLKSQESERIYEVVWDEYGGFVAKDSVAGVCLPIFLGSALRTIDFKVIGNKFDKEK